MGPAGVMGRYWLNCGLHILGLECFRVPDIICPASVYQTAISEVSNVHTTHMDYALQLGSFGGGDQLGCCVW